MQLPGHENRYREAPFTRMADALAALLPILDGRGELPFAFFGHSLGALIAFELARLLRRRGHAEPVHLFVSARRAPQIPEPWSRISHLPTAEFLDAVRIRYDGIPEAILRAPDLLAITLPAMKADFEIIENYFYQNEDSFDYPISAFGGSWDSTVAPSELEAWRAQTRGRFRLRLFSGDHFFLHRCRAELIEAISGELKTTMEQAGRGGTS